MARKNNFPGRFICSYFQVYNLKAVDYSSLTDQLIHDSSWTLTSSKLR